MRRGAGGGLAAPAVGGGIGGAPPDCPLACLLLLQLVSRFFPMKDAVVGARVGCWRLSLGSSSCLLALAPLTPLLARRARNWPSVWLNVGL